MKRNFTYLAFLTAFVMLIVSAKLVAQINLTKDVAPANSGKKIYGNLSVSDFHRKVASFIMEEDTHKEQKLFSKSNIADNCNSSICKTFVLSFAGASNTMLIPDQVVFINNSNGKPYGGLDSRDFIKGKHTQFMLPLGEYTMIAKHHMYDDYIYKGINVTAENLHDIEYLQNTGMGLNSESSPINIPIYDPKGMHILGQVKDIQTGLPLAGVKVSVAEFYPNYNGDHDIVAITDQFGYFFSEKVIPFATSQSNTETINGYSGDKQTVRVLLKYEYPGYEDADKDNSDASYNHFNLGTDQIGISGYGFLQRRGVNLKDLPITEIKKLRVVPNQSEFFKIYQRSSSCTVPNTIRVGIGCTSCKGGCTQYKYGGSPNLILDRYVTAVLVSEWSSAWGNSTDGMNSLYAGAVAIRTIGAYFINNPVNTNLYDIGGDNCWQVFNKNYFANIMQNPNYYPNPGAAVSSTSGWILREDGKFPKSEYAAETNNLPSCSGSSCGNGKFQHANTGYSGGCYPTYGIDYVSLGKSYCATGSHPRGMGQRSSMRWASGFEVNNDLSLGSKILPATYTSIAYCKKSWQQILAHYYPYYTLENCNTQKVINLASVIQVCNLLPDLTDGGSSRSPNGRNITITASIVNAGNSIAGPASFTTRFVLSPDIYLGNDYHLVYLNYNNFTISPSSTYNYTFTWNIQSSIPSGNYYLLETLDYNDAVKESNENNSWYFSGQFYVPPYFQSNTSDNYTNNLDIDTINIIKNNLNDYASRFVIPTSIKSKLINNCKINYNNPVLIVNEIGYENFRIYDLIGHPLKEGKLDQMNINFGDLPSGIYILDLSGEKQNKCIQKIYIE